MKIFKTIQFRLLLFATIMSLVPLLILGGYNLHAARLNLESAIRYHQALVSMGIAEDMSTMLEEAKRTFLVLAKTEGMRFAENELKERERILYACLTSLPYVDEISAIDNQGQALAQVSRLLLNPEVPMKQGNSKNLLKELQSLKPYISDVYLDEDNQPAFLLAMPFQSPNQFTGGFVAKISLRNIVKQITLASANQDEYIFLVDRDGHLIGHEDYSQVLSQKDVRLSLPSEEDLARGIEKGYPLVRNYQSYTGEKVVGAYVPVEGTEWAVILEEPERFAYASYAQLRRTFLLSTLGLILAVLVISLSFCLSFGRRLTILKHGVGKIHNGELGCTIPVETEDEIGEILLAFNHLSEELERKKHVEAAMRQADKMVTVGLLASGVAHEINNPLAVIYLSVEELLERFDGGELGQEEPSELKRYLKAIAEQSERCSVIIRQLLEFAHQSRQEDIQESLFDLNDLIQKNVNLIQFRLRKQEILLVQNFASNLPFLWGDGSGIQQVIFNLICNAMDAMPNGGTLTLSTKSEGGKVEFTIQDTGIGIPMDQLPRVFEPFYTTKPPGKGTGLGLSVCYGLVQKAQGKIEIESSLGVGTIVRVTLPCKGESNEYN